MSGARRSSGPGATKGVLAREALLALKGRIFALWQDLDLAPAGRLAEVGRLHFGSSFSWRGPAPLPTASGIEGYVEAFLSPLTRSLSELSRHPFMLLAGVSEGKTDGSFDGRTWVAGTGVFRGRHIEGFAGILPAVSGAPEVKLRWAEFYHFDGEELVEVQTLLDLADWCEQIGLPILPKPRGLSFVYPAPTAYDGVFGDQPDQQLRASSGAETRRTLALTRNLLFAGLNTYDQHELASMGIARLFHPNLKWYGPGGIGACLSLEEFESLHQAPWLAAFPDRKVQDLDALIAEGRLSAAAGWAGVRARHLGPYLHIPASGQPLEIAGMDFWLRTGGQFTENWVFVDMVHLFAQMGVDLLEPIRPRKAAQGGRPMT